MRITFICTILLLLFLFSCKKEAKNQVVSQPKTDLIINTDSITSNKNPENIDDIKNEFALMNEKLRAKRYDSTTFDYQCDEVYGNVVYYTEKGDLKSIKHIHGDSHFSSVENYYLNNGKLFFIYQKETLWSFDGGTSDKPDTKDDIQEKRFYYINDKLNYCRNKKYTVRTKNQSKPENIYDEESKNCDDGKLRKTFEILLKNKEKTGKNSCIQ